jgi:hypothetical protein
VGAGDRQGSCLADHAPLHVEIYVVNFFVFAPLLFPWLIESRGGIVPTLIHPVCGAIAAAAYLKLRRAPVP